MLITKYLRIPSGRMSSCIEAAILHPTKLDKRIERMAPHFLYSAVCMIILSLGTSVFCQEPPTNSAGNAPATQRLESPSPERVKLSTKDTKKLVVKRVRPQYPNLARQARIIGRCGVRVVITPQGKLGEVSLVYAHPILAQAALDAVRKWEFKPYLLHGHPVEVEGEVELNVP
jgi:TonB family protein